MLLSNISACLGIIGTILIFMFGISPINRGDENTYLVVGSENKVIKTKIKIYDIFSRIGLLCLLVSFILQLKF